MLNNVIDRYKQALAALEAAETNYRSCCNALEDALGSEKQHKIRIAKYHLENAKKRVEYCKAFADGIKAVIDII